MFNTLIVEDNIGTLKELAALCHDTFAECHIDTAATVAEAEVLVREFLRQNRAYDFVILDFKLPAKTGENPEVDETLCKDLTSKMPDALVAHITGYIDDPAVLQHLRVCHTEEFVLKLTFSKKTVSWPEELVRGLEKVYHTRRIRRELDALFMANASPSAGAKGYDRYAGFRGARSTTHRLGSLSKDIGEHWHKLDGTLKERIRGLFTVDESQEVIRLSLL